MVLDKSFHSGLRTETKSFRPAIDSLSCSVGIRPKTHKFQQTNQERSTGHQLPGQPGTGGGEERWVGPGGGQPALGPLRQAKATEHLSCHLTSDTRETRRKPWKPSLFPVPAHMREPIRVLFPRSLKPAPPPSPAPPPATTSAPSSPGSLSWAINNRLFCGVPCERRHTQSQGHGARGERWAAAKRAGHWLHSGLGRCLRRGNPQGDAPARCGGDHAYKDTPWSAPASVNIFVETALEKLLLLWL